MGPNRRDGLRPTPEKTVAVDPCPLPVCKRHPKLPRPCLKCREERVAMAGPPRALSQTLAAKRNRRHRLRKKALGTCSRCWRDATPGFATCDPCRDEAKRLMRIWRTR